MFNEYLVYSIILYIVDIVCSMYIVGNTVCITHKTHRYIGGEKVGNYCCGQEVGMACHTTHISSSPGDTKEVHTSCLNELSYRGKESHSHTPKYVATLSHIKLQVDLQYTYTHTCSHL